MYTLTQVHDFSPLQKQKGSAVKKNRRENNGDEGERCMKTLRVSVCMRAFLATSNTPNLNEL